VPWSSVNTERRQSWPEVPMPEPGRGQGTDKAESSGHEPDGRHSGPRRLAPYACNLPARTLGSRGDSSSTFL
jgi:hypothetical protein